MFYNYYDFTNWITCHTICEICRSLSTFSYVISKVFCLLITTVWALETLCTIRIYRRAEFTIYQGVYKSSLTKFQISRIHLTKFQQNFYTDRAFQVLQHGIQTHALSVTYDIINKTAQKMVKWQFLRFKDVIRFGSVIGILSHFSWQLSFSGASLKLQEISRSCRHPVQYMQRKNSSVQVTVSYLKAKTCTKIHSELFQKSRLTVIQQIKTNQHFHTTYIIDYKLSSKHRTDLQLMRAWQ